MTGVIQLLVLGLLVSNMKLRLRCHSESAFDAHVYAKGSSGETLLSLSSFIIVAIITIIIGLCLLSLSIMSFVFIVTMFFCHYH